MTAQQLFERLKLVLEKKPELRDRPVMVEIRVPNSETFMVEMLTDTDPIFEFSFKETGEIRHLSREATYEWDGVYDRPESDMPDPNPIEYFGLSNRFELEP